MRKFIKQYIILIFTTIFMTGLLTGVVYKSDTVVSNKVKIIAEAPANSHKPIVYPAAVISSTKQEAVAEEFMKFLQTDEARQIFLKYGFAEFKK